MKRIARSIAGLMPVLTSSVVAGPPMSTEDPGIVRQGQWEIITATTVTATDGDDAYQLPVLDISLGVIDEQVEIAATYPYVFADPEGEDSDSDFGNLELSLKWRFWNSDDFQMAFAPVYAFGITRSLAERGIGDDSDVLTLPLVAEYRLNQRVRLNTAVGYAIADEGGDEWSYGLAAAYRMNDRWEWLFEFYGATDTDLDDGLLDVRAGFDFAIREDFHLLFSAATGVVDSGDFDGLDYDLYLGLQWFR